MGGGAPVIGGALTAAWEAGRAGGRLGGSELARVEWYKEGKIPLHTLRENIEYGFAEAHTVAGLIGGIPGRF